MNINLAPKDEEYLKNKVEAGYYVNMAEAIRDAIRRMRDAEGFNSELYNAVMVGEQQLAGGKGVPFTDELHQTIVENARKKAKSKARLNPDVFA